jgi:hypothetical protein
MTEQGFISAFGLAKSGGVGDIMAKKLLTHCGALPRQFSKQRWQRLMGWVRSY